MSIKKSSAPTPLEIYEARLKESEHIKKDLIQLAMTFEKKHPELVPELQAKIIDIFEEGIAETKSKLN